ncbi:PREDICTED: nucleolar protein 9 isoform X1 [Pseudopodoces humilis]|uniref:nucleolar protein 9 isoform X1 n=1 Tax=Pseudopodoces humilis TaxID=181119 RepID=UPI0006B6E851|nr:PREDICTED: nucleolar protein 9 isoform X1 [Pseudopodoces humilis]
MAAHTGSPPGPDLSRQRRQSGPRLDPDTAEYFRRALETLEEGLSEEELVPPPEGAEPKAKKAWPDAKGAWLGAKGAWPPRKGAELPASFRPLLEELAEGLEREMPSLLAPPCASLCLQGALFALHRSQSPSCSRFCRALIGCLTRQGPAHPQSPLLTSLQDPARSRLLEAAMTVLDPPGLRELFRGHLRGHLRGVASHRVANHGLQRLLDHAPEDVVEEALSELGPALQEPLAWGHPGVVVALLGAAQRHARLQGAALRWLFQALRCWDPPHHPHCVTALAQLRPLGGGDSDEKAELEGKEAEPEGKGAEPEGKEAEPEPFPVPTLWGSLALQLLLNFGDPSPIWGSLGSLPPPALLGLARSPPGSRVWDSLLGSPGVPPRARRRLLRKLQGHWPALARDRSGSRVLDAAWASGRPRQRARMAEELAPHLPELLRDPLGRGVARNLGLELFQRDREKWEELQRGAGLRGRGLSL